jgi:glycosyltransferase involved in cell wall biosynthesis
VLSFVVPAYNDEFELPGTLEAIHSAARDHDYEIIVADDGSTDGTATVARDARAKLISINRRQIAAARNAGGRAAIGDVLFFVDADTQINYRHVAGAIAALEAGYSGGSSRVAIGGAVPTWSRVFLKIFCTIYFGFKLGAGAFLFTTKKNFETAGGFDENLFVGEEVYFSLALRKLGRFRILREPIVTSGRKLRIYSAREILMNSFYAITHGTRAARTREGLEIWYEGKRETRSTTVS